jgi:hypothetical protein
VLAMSPQYVAKIHRHFRAFAHKVFTLRGYAYDATGPKESPDHIGGPWTRTVPPCPNPTIMVNCLSCA